MRVEAAPLNPSDLGLLFGAADMTTAVVACYSLGTQSSIEAGLVAAFTTLWPPHQGTD